MELVRRSIEENLHTVVSIFVNPTQFNDPADFARYPKTLDADLDLCRRSGATHVYAPTPQDVYPTDAPIPVPPLPRVATAPGLCYRSTLLRNGCEHRWWMSPDGSQGWGSAGNFHEARGQLRRHGGRCGQLGGGGQVERGRRLPGERGQRVLQLGAAGLRFEPLHLGGLVLRLGLRHVGRRGHARALAVARELPAALVRGQGVVQQ